MVEDEKQELAEIVSEAAVGDTKPDREDTGVPMWSGEALVPLSIQEITEHQESRLVFVAGMPGSGKTTLLAEIYSHFLRGPFIGYRFAGSRTLPRFERICHHARIESERGAPDTEHTRFVDEAEFVHLLLADSRNRMRAVFLSDISGEAFSHVRDAVDEARRYQIALHADVFCIVLDGGQMADLSKRQAGVRDVHLMCQSFMDAGILCSNARVHIILSRVDLLPADRANSAWAFVTSTIRRLSEMLASRGIADVLHFELAARPRTGPRLGVEALAHAWFDEPESLNPHLPQFGESDAKDDFGRSVLRETKGRS